ncbi:hypothetical protein DY218_28310 [Streptomyces triticagri]|uniref:Uncharacterized protein n=1 Tax=Streptomyces triticagri TaxID=2293568 RepID=A0A372LY88_9ACTN|nr:hypothetical protein [Streptomyces triticagri]RFU83340.1 hypothetical protein DY218_28310 [Streptomyces triticagri]
MEFTCAAQPGTGADDEADLVVTGSHFALVLGGAEEGCRHLGRWRTRALGGRLADELVRRPDAPLTALLDAALAGVREFHHRQLCLGGAPGAPSSVAVVRERDGLLDLLVRGGAAALVQFPDVTVNAVLAPADGGAPGGPAPEAAVGSLPVKDLSRVCLLGGGAHRMAEPYEAYWPYLFDRFATDGPGAVLTATPYRGAAAALGTPRP